MHRFLGAVPLLWRVLRSAPAEALSLAAVPLRSDPGVPLARSGRWDCVVAWRYCHLE